MGRALLDAMVKSPVAWLSPALLASALGWDVEETTDRLADLDLGGWIEIREEEPDNALVVSLSPLGAERLGLRLVEQGEAGRLRWSGIGEPDPPSPRARHVSLGERGADLSVVPDPGPDPETTAILGEKAEQVEQNLSKPAATPIPAAPLPARPRAGAVGRQEELPHPSLLLGMGLTPWPGPKQSPDPAATCPACGSKKLRPHAYCLYCDRWGLDPLVAPAAPPALVPLSSPPVGPRPAREVPSGLRETRDARESQRLRTERKARRQRRHSGREDARSPLPSAGS